jgi:anti-sigma factor RsiW
MEHAQIEEENLIDRYVRGTLPVDLRAMFEEHFLDCPDCLEQLKLAESLREGLRLSAADLAASAVAPHEIPPAARLRGWFAWRWAPVVAAAGLVLALAPSLVLLRELAAARNELATGRAALGAAQKTIDQVSRAGAAVYILSPVRGQAATTRIVVAPSSAWTVLTLESDFSRFAAYRATLRNDRGQIVWQKDGLQPSSPDAIGVVLAPNLLSAPGLYKVVVEGQDGPGRYLPAATFSFSVSRT